MKLLLLISPLEKQSNNDINCLNWYFLIHGVIYLFEGIENAAGAMDTTLQIPSLSTNPKKEIKNKSELDGLDGLFGGIECEAIIAALMAQICVQMLGKC